jgi:hypothetical protein
MKKQGKKNRSQALTMSEVVERLYDLRDDLWSKKYARREAVELLLDALTLKGEWVIAELYEKVIEETNSEK